MELTTEVLLLPGIPGIPVWLGGGVVGGVAAPVVDNGGGVAPVVGNGGGGGRGMHSGTGFSHSLPMNPE